MTRSELEVLRDVARLYPLPRDYFDSYPHKRSIARRLMWSGYLELGGTFGERVFLTPAGHHAIGSVNFAGPAPL